MKFFCFFFLLTLAAPADIIDDLRKNPKVIIVYGENAPEEEKKVAQDMYSSLELDSLDSLTDHIVADTYVIKHLFFYTTYHLIIVGTKKSNKLCNFNAEIQNAQAEDNLDPGRIFPSFNLTGKGFFGARYGYYPETAGIGYVRRMLSPITMQAYNLTEGKVKTIPYTATFITGTDSEGVLNSYVAFMDNKMMDGAIIPQKYLMTKNSRFRLSKDGATQNFPSSFNEKFSLETQGSKLTYKGWIQGALADFAGIKKLTGQSAKQIFHTKFQDHLPTLMTYDDQINTFLLVRFNSSEEALKALKKMDETLQLSLAIKENESFQFFPCSTGNREWSVSHKGEFLVIENLAPQWKKEFYKNPAKLFK